MENLYTYLVCDVGAIDMSTRLRLDTAGWRTYDIACTTPACGDLRMGILLAICNKKDHRPAHKSISSTGNIVSTSRYRSFNTASA